MRNDMLDALFPRTRQNILAALLLSPERRWYLVIWRSTFMFRRRAFSVRWRHWRMPA